MIKRFTAWLILIIVFHHGYTQNDFDNAGTYSGKSFIEYQKSFTRPMESTIRKEKYLKTLFEVKGLAWPAKYVYIRSFKYDSQLEVWVKDAMSEPYKLLKIYKICALAGTLGPKRFQGDYQVPEGFYYIDRFNPNSGYYLSLGLNYPNASDYVLGQQQNWGGDIYIHGGCATTGCIPILDEQIDELYILCANAKSAGLDFIPVHIFPINYNVQRSYEYLAKIIKEDSVYRKFSDKMEEAFDYFENHKQIPLVFIKEDGSYVVNNAAPKILKFQPKLRPVSTFKPTVRKIEDLATSVAKWPQYPGGGTALEAFLKQVASEMTAYFPDGISKAFVQLEFIIDTDGTPVNFKILKGVDEYFNLELISKMEKMPKWTPAILREKPVAKKMIQTVAIGVN